MCVSQESPERDSFAPSLAAVAAGWVGTVAVGVSITPRALEGKTHASTLLSWEHECVPWNQSPSVYFLRALVMGFC